MLEGINLQPIAGHMSYLGELTTPKTRGLIAYPGAESIKSKCFKYYINNLLF